MGVVRAAKRTGRAVGKSRKGIPHKLTPQRAAQIHRWQMLGAAAKKGQRKAATTAHRTQTAKAKRAVVGTYASTAAKGTARLLLPTSLVTPFIPGWQPGDRLPGMGHLRRKRR